MAQNLFVKKGLYSVVNIKNNRYFLGICTIIDVFPLYLWMLLRIQAVAQQITCYKLFPSQVYQKFVLFQCGLW